MNNFMDSTKKVLTSETQYKYSLITKDVKNICQPLFEKHGINAFSYSKVYFDGSRTELWSNEEALYHTFLKKRYIADSYTPDNYQNDERYVSLASKIESCSAIIKERYFNQLLDQRNLFNHDNCFMIINKLCTFCEYFIFYTPSSFGSSINFYLNNLRILESFTIFFKENASELIKIADQYKIIKPWRELKSRRNLKVLLDFERTQNKKIRLTNREVDVGQLLIKGKTAKEIANSLNLSIRTIEFYIENMKNKLLCNRKTDLVVKLLKLGKL